VTEAGLEIPIPTRDAFVQNLAKVAPKPPTHPEPRQDS
jgi:hypothetical protein